MAEVKVRSSEIRAAIVNNDKIEDKLHVIMAISNPCNYKRRYKLAKEFIWRMSETSDVELYIVEMAYSGQTFHVTTVGDPRHLQLRGDAVLWAKENCVCVGVKKLLPPNWKAMAWIDADIEFENCTWASDTLKILNGCKDVVQIFSHCMDMDAKENTMQVFHGFGYQFDTGKQYYSNGTNFWHPGFAWACTRKAYERMGGLLDISILGAGDHQMALAFLKHTRTNAMVTDGYKEAIRAFGHRAANLRLGYVPGVIRHFYHGSKKNRKYSERWKILVSNKYDPYKHVTYDEHGVLVATPECPPKLLQDILQYFQERNEDET